MSERTVKTGDGDGAIVKVRGLEGEGYATPVVEIRTERSLTLKYLRLRSGDLQCYQRVIIKTEDGQECQITVDELPEEPI